MPIVDMPSPIPRLSRIGALIRFALWGFTATVVATFDYFRRRWGHAVMLNEAATGAVARFQGEHKLAREYLFHNSGWIYRPLWTYDAEARGSKVTFYFYSTNCESFKTADGYPVQANSWQVMTWPCYLVWDEYQADFARRAVGANANIDVVGQIWFASSARELPSLPVASVAVFDVQPHRASRYRMLGEPLEYYTPETANQLLLDAHLAICAAGGVMVLKRKRDIGTLVHPRYAGVLARLNGSDRFVAVDPDISAIRVIEKCAAVISMPFSSTALIARDLGKPSIYYDPHGVVQRDDRAAHGIPVVIGSDELRQWITAQLARIEQCQPSSPRIYA